MRVLMSIKPEYAVKIFEKEKKFEFRKAIFKNPDITTIVVYASSPIQMVIGEFQIEEIISNTPEKIWRKTKANSGITEDFFFEYFADRDIAHAIKIKDIKKYNKPLCIKKHYKATAPQSYIYIK